MVYTPVGITAGTSSFDVEPASSLDPDLFDGTHMRSEVRLDLLSTISAYMDANFQGKDRWLRVWLAGSGVSYRWHASQGLRDLDVLLGIHFVSFRQSNPGFLQLGDAEIARHLNDRLRRELWPSTSSWRGQYEVTWYVNPGSWDITNIKPYAAYDLVADDWTVPPSPAAARVDPSWGVQVGMYHERATKAAERYSEALTALQNAPNPAARVDAERRFQMAVEQAVNLFDTVHAGRKTSFSPTGQGYEDFGNYLWQMGKREGWIQALRQIKDYHQTFMTQKHVETYGVELPDTDTLIRRAAMRYR